MTFDTIKQRCASFGDGIPNQLLHFLYDHRIARLRLAVTSSVATKLVRLIVQTLLIGIAIRHLGVETYGIWLTTIAALGWLSWGQAGLAPGLVNAISTAEGAGRVRDQGIYFTTALVLISAAAAIAFAGGLIVIQIGASFSQSFGIAPSDQASGSDGTTWLSFVQIGLAIALLRLPLGLIESAFVGIQCIHILRLWEIVGQALGLGAALLAVYFDGSAVLLLLAIGLATECGVLAAGLHLVLRLRPHLMPSAKSFDLAACRGMFNLNGGYLILQVAGYLVAHVGTLILATYHGAAAVPTFVLTWQLYLMASGIWMMVVTGSWGAFGEARARDEWAWIEHGQRLLIVGAMSLSIAFSLMLAIWGDRLLDIWSGGRVQTDQRFLIAMAVHCSVFTWAILHAQVLSALGIVWKQMHAAVANGALVVILSWILVPTFGATGLALALLTAGLLTTAWVYPALLSSTMRDRVDVAA